MANVNEEMQSVVAQFVAQVTALARQAAVEILDAGFAHSSAAQARLPKADTRAPVAAPVGRPPGRGAKRTAADLEKLALDIATYIKANPGQRIEQINKGLGKDTKELALPIRKLIEEGVITSKGQKRATTYYIGKKGK